MLVFGVFFKASYHPHISSLPPHNLSGLPFFLASTLFWISLCASWCAKGTQVPPVPLTGYFQLLTECLALSLALLPPSSPQQRQMFHWEKWITPLMPQCVPLMYAQLLISEKKKILWKSVLSIKWLLGSEKMTDSFCSYEKWMFPSDFNYEPLNWMFCCYPSKNSIGEKSNLELCDNQSKETTNGLCLLALYYMKKKKCSNNLLFERCGEERN